MIIVHVDGTQETVALLRQYFIGSPTFLASPTVCGSLLDISFQAQYFQAVAQMLRGQHYADDHSLLSPDGVLHWLDSMSSTLIFGLAPTCTQCLAGRCENTLGFEKLILWIHSMFTI